MYDELQMGFSLNSETTHTRRNKTAVYIRDVRYELFADIQYTDNDQTPNFQFSISTDTNIGMVILNLYKQLYAYEIN